EDLGHLVAGEVTAPVEALAPPLQQALLAEPVHGRVGPVVLVHVPEGVRGDRSLGSLGMERSQLQADQCDEGDLSHGVEAPGGLQALGLDVSGPGAYPGSLDITFGRSG